MDEAPASLKNAAIAQIVAGLINVFFMSFVSWFGIGTVCGVLTIILGGFGGVCGMLGCLLIPFGVVEIIVGALALSNPKSFGSISRMLGFVEVAALLLGSIPSAIAGGVVVMMTGSEEAKAYLEG